MRTLAVAALALTALLAAPAGAAMPDPAARGPFSVRVLEYQAGTVTLHDEESDRTLEARLRGIIHLPAGDGPFPVLMFLHGRHGTCELAAVPDHSIFGDCQEPNSVEQEDLSYRGYDYIGDNLASHGYVVASIDANDINAWDAGARDSGMLARAELVASSLDLLDRWSHLPGPEPVGAALLGRLDLDRLGLMGHSRGGEGVTKFLALDRERPPHLRHPPDAVLALAAVDFFEQNPTGTHFAAVLPYCDGDVYDLQGANAFERSKHQNTAGGFASVQWGVNAANHNFFNTRWEDDDSAYFTLADPYCVITRSPTRLDHAEQQRIGLVLIGGFLRRFVGPERALDPLVTGAELPASACPNPRPDQGLTCENVVLPSYIAPASERLTLLGPAAGDALTTSAVGTPLRLEGFTSARACTPNYTGGVLGGAGCGSEPNRSVTPQVSLSWTGAASLAVDLPASLSDVRRFAALHLRGAVNFSDPLNAGIIEQDLAVELIDAAGRTASSTVAERSAALEPARGTTSREVVLGGIRLPLPELRGVDLSAVRTVALRFGEATPRGSIQLADLAFQECAGACGGAQPAAPISRPSAPGAPAPAARRRAERAPRAAVRAASRRARHHFGRRARVRVTSSLRSRRDRRWALVTGSAPRGRIWAAWARSGRGRRWTVRIFATRRLDPGRRVPCDVRPAFSESAC